MAHDEAESRLPHRDADVGRVRVDDALEEVHPVDSPWEWVLQAAAWQVLRLLAGIGTATVPPLWDCVSGRRRCVGSWWWPRSALDWLHPLLLWGYRWIEAKATTWTCCCSDRSPHWQRRRRRRLEVLLCRVVRRRLCG